MKFPGAGYVTLGVIYSNGGTADRMFNAYLDHDYYVSAPPTGSWDTWDTAYVVMDAPLGEADLRFISLTSDGAPNIDAFGFSIDGVCRVSEGCPKDTIPTVVRKVSPADGFALRGETLRLANAERADVSVFDMRGSLVARETFEGMGEVSLSSMVKSTGLYRIVVRQGSAKFTATYAKVR